jgi:hypothetical protein
VKSLSRRIGKLEQYFPAPEDLRKPILSRALAAVSADDLSLMIEAAEAEEQGHAPTAEQIAAIENLGKKFDAECVAAGYKSGADFDRKHPIRQLERAAASTQGRTK